MVYLIVFIYFFMVLVKWENLKVSGKRERCDYFKMVGYYKENIYKLLRDGELLKFG